MNFQIARRAGPLQNGFERGRGVRYHAVQQHHETSICGGKAPRDWSSTPGDTVTCPACMKALLKFAEVVFVPGAPERVSF